MSAKKEGKRQLLFNELLDEVERLNPPVKEGSSRLMAQSDNNNLNRDNQGFLNQTKDDVLKDETFNKAQKEALFKEKKRLQIQERYTKYCIEWIMGLHIKARLTSNFIPHVDKILPFYQTQVYDENHTFLSALISFKDYQGATLFLNYPPVKKVFFSPQKEGILNWPMTKKALFHAMTKEDGVHNSDFNELWQTLKQAYGATKLYDMVLFDGDEKSPVDIEKVALFPKKEVMKNQYLPVKKEKKETVQQTALSFLITRGYLMETLDYISHLPKGTSIGTVCQLVQDPLASRELKRLSTQPYLKNKKEALFLKTLQENMPTPVFLYFMQQYEGVKAYRGEDIFDKRAKEQPFMMNIKEKSNVR